MTIAELGSIGEFVGSFAVLATLIYLATQIKHSQKFAMAQAFQGRTDLAVQLGGNLLQLDSDLLAKVAPTDLQSELFVDATKIDDLTREEQSRLRVAFYGMVYITDNSLYQVELGLMPDAHLESLAASSTLDYLGPCSRRLGVPLTPRVERALTQHEQASQAR
ncbi:MAG TPA: hypothetical protein VIS55_12115 [Pseudomonadales bacterium]|jgi:hypothetical protein